LEVVDRGDRKIGSRKTNLYYHYIVLSYRQIVLSCRPIIISCRPIVLSCRPIVISCGHIVLSCRPIVLSCRLSSCRVALSSYCVAISSYYVAISSYRVLLSSCRDCLALVSCKHRSKAGGQSAAEGVCAGIVGTRRSPDSGASSKTDVLPGRRRHIRTSGKEDVDSYKTGTCILTDKVISVNRDIENSSIMGKRNVNQKWHTTSILHSEFKYL
jgi:hypothetical protein